MHNSVIGCHTGMVCQRLVVCPALCGGIVVT